MVQQRLKDLGFDPGPVDGAYGPNTQQAIWAFEKLVLGTPRADATGKVTDEMWQRMQDNLTISPLRPTGAGTTHVEVYVPSRCWPCSPTTSRCSSPTSPPAIRTPTAHRRTGARRPPTTPTPRATRCPNRYQAGVRGRQDARRRVPHPALRPGQPRQPARRDVQPGVLQLRHRHPRRAERAAGAGLARLRADQPHVVARRSPTWSSKGDLVYVWAQDGKQPEQYSKNESLPSFN